MTADLATNIETFQQGTHSLRVEMRESIIGTLSLRAGGLMTREFLEEEVEANFTDLHNEVAVAHTDLVEQIETLTETGAITLVDKKYFTLSSLRKVI
jgi:hypothetical protein